MQHSKIGASSMYRWLNCPGSVRMSADIPRTTTEYAAEGTAAHFLAEQCLKKDKFTAQSVVKSKGKAGIFVNGDNGECHFRPKAPDDMDGFFVEVNDEMIEAVNVYLGVVAGFMEDDPDAQLLVEQRVSLPQIHDSLFGTSDSIVWQPTFKRLIPIDFKYGAGVAVEVTGNLQARYYALGALLETGWRAASVRPCIVQPRCPHPDGLCRYEDLDPIDLMDFAGQLREAAQATEDPDAPLYAGDWCRWCPAAAICPEIKRQAQANAQKEFAPDLSYDPQDLAETLEWLPVLEAWIKNVRQFAYNEHQHGRHIPAHKLVEKRATRKWKDEDEAVKVLEAAALDEDDIFQTKLRTPAQIEKVLGKENKEVLEDLVVSESSGLTLVHETDKRPAVSVSPQDEFRGA